MWAQLINTLLGLWLMSAPAVLGYGAPAATNDRIVGPVAATFACVAIWEVTRAVRWINLALGIWLLPAPWVLGYESIAATVNALCAGLLLAAMACVRGKMTHRFAGGWAALVK